MTSDRDPAKRVPKSLGTDAKLFGTYTLTDVAVALFPGVLVLLVTQVVLPSTLTIAGYPLSVISLPATAVAIGAGALFVYLTPDYMTSLTWLTTLARYRRRTKRLSTELARGTTLVERIHPSDGVIERADGALLGMVAVDPPAMALATDAEWAAKAEAFRDFLNTVVEFPIQLYSTTQRFPIEAYLERYESRLGDPDVKANPRLAALIEDYVDWYAAELDARRMTIREHYVVVPVATAEVRFEPAGLVGQLASLPILGAFLKVWLSPGAGDLHAAMVEELDERLRRVEAGLREIDGCAASRVDIGDAVRLQAEFWSGEPRDWGDMDRVIRTRPVVGGAG